MTGLDAALWPPATAASRGHSIDVLGVGENSIDRVGIVEALPSFGEKASLDHYSEHAGGQVATTIVACAHLGLRCAYQGVTGDDPEAQRALSPLEALGVDLSRVVRVAGARTRLALILVARSSGERIVLGYRDPKLLIHTDALDRSAVEAARVVAIDASDLDVARWVARVAHEVGNAVVLDADRASDAIFALLPDVDFPIVAESFAESMGEGGTPDRALRELASQGAKLAVVTRGRLGALARMGDRTVESPAFEVDAIDTTGAGDAFRGGFIRALLDGRNAANALRYANAVAAMNCREMGAQGGLPGLAELEAFVARGG